MAEADFNFLDELEAIWGPWSPKLRVSVAGNAGRSVLSSLGFAMAHRAVAERPEALAIIVRPRCKDDDGLKAVGGTYGDGEELERIWFKYLESGADAAWFFNNVHRWREATSLRLPTTLVLDGWIEGNASRMLLLLKLLDDAATHLGAAAIVVADAPLGVLRRYFPAVVAVQSSADGQTHLTIATPSPPSPALTPSDPRKAQRPPRCAAFVVLDRCSHLAVVPR